MFYVDPRYPLPIDIGSPILSKGYFYVSGDFGFPGEYCFDTRIKAIEKIMEIEHSICFVRPVWSYCHYHKLPKKILVYWTYQDKKQILMQHDSGTAITSKHIFNTELEAINFAINNPDPIFLNRMKELI